MAVGGVPVGVAVGVAVGVPGVSVGVDVGAVPVGVAVGVSGVLVGVAVPGVPVGVAVAGVPVVVGVAVAGVPVLVGVAVEVGVAVVVGVAVPGAWSRSVGLAAAVSELFRNRERARNAERRDAWFAYAATATALLAVAPRVNARRLIRRAVSALSVRSTTASASLAAGERRSVTPTSPRRGLTPEPSTGPTTGLKRSIRSACVTNGRRRVMRGASQEVAAGRRSVEIVSEAVGVAV